MVWNAISSGFAVTLPFAVAMVIVGTIGLFDVSKAPAAVSRTALGMVVMAGWIVTVGVGTVMLALLVTGTDIAPSFAFVGIIGTLMWICVETILFKKYGDGGPTPTGKRIAALRSDGSP
ncbi:hypothetical protein [Natrarchaeobius oligotrophus]|nr:hypothetical protein [Natrarchaeobius chitinivorans]